VQSDQVELGSLADLGDAGQTVESDWAILLQSVRVRWVLLAEFGDGPGNVQSVWALVF
jgi:hypothetical protein